MTMNKRKILVFTGTRAEYGLLYWILKELDSSAQADLVLCAGGMHLSPEFGKTVSQIESDGFRVDETIEFLLSSDSPVGIAKSVGLATISAAEMFARVKPDLLVVLGDRFELLGICQAAMVAQCPIAHIHGGEITEGLIDDAVRHSITKMSHLHFTSTDTYRERVIQLGEEPARVFNFGAPGIDSIAKLSLLDKTELSNSLSFDITDNDYAVVTYHPVTLDKDGALNDFRNLLKNLEQLQGFKYIISYPNADTFGRALISELEDFQKRHSDRVLLTKSLGQLRYLSLLKHANVVIGNSSSGLIEAPSFGIPTVNIGERQRGRVAGDSVIHCNGDFESIGAAISLALSENFRRIAKNGINPYGQGNSSNQIVEVMLNFPLERIIAKRFYDLK